MKMTETEILPELKRAVRVFGTVHYKQATKFLINRGVWGDSDPITPELTVNNCFTTSRDENGLPVFEQVSSGTYKMRESYF